MSTELPENRPFPVSPGRSPGEQPASGPAALSLTPPPMPNRGATLPELVRDEAFVIETPRLWLRWPRAADAPALQRFTALREVAEMTASWPHPLPPLEAETRILKARQVNEAGRGLILAITRKKEPGRLVGTVGVDVARTADGKTGAGTGSDAGPGLGLSYMLDPAVHKRGLATEAVQGLIAAAFMFTPFKVILAECWIGNGASRRVLEKCGFEPTGDVLMQAPARSQPMPCHTYRLTRQAWQHSALPWAGRRKVGTAA